MYKILLTTGIIGVALVLSGCSNNDEQSINYSFYSEEPVGLSLSKTKSISKNNSPLPSLASLNISTEKANLGNMLYHDTRLSGDGTLSCSSCHSIVSGGGDSLPVAIGINGQKGPINSPTVLNSGFSFKQFWDGRASNLRTQAEGPVENPGEMGAKWEDVVPEIAKVEEYVKLFEVAYPELGISKLTITDAIAEFERSLITPSPMDDYLSGDDSALSKDQKMGYKLFTSYGCVSCHQGVNFGGNMMQKFGALQAYFSEKEGKGVDYGLFNVTNNKADKNVFKVPSLRNVELTAPYFHNAGATELDAAVKIMGLNQLGRKIPSEERFYIVEFLKSLTGEVQVKEIAPPKDK